jgi:hypothetical protein
MRTITVMHLAECEPEQHPDWEKTTHSAGAAAGAVLCDQTQYMEGELFPDEEVWTERRERQLTPAEQALADLRAALDQAKVHWDHGDAPYDPDLLALFRAAEKVLGAFSNGDEPDPASLIH